MKLAFKISQNTWYDMLIQAWQWARGDAYSHLTHVELVFSDGMSFSASVMDKGVRFKRIGYSNADEWVFVPIEHANEQRLYEACKVVALGSKGYSFLDIAAMTLGVKMNVTNKWFCSEVVSYVLAPFAESHISPSELYERYK